MFCKFLDAFLNNFNEKMYTLGAIVNVLCIYALCLPLYLLV